MSTDASALAVATTAMDSEISRTVKATLVLVVSAWVVATRAARSTPAASYVPGSSRSPTMTVRPSSWWRSASSRSATRVTWAIPARSRRVRSAASMGPVLVKMTWSRTSSSTRRGALARCVDSIQGRNTNWMKVNGSSTRMKTEPESSTTTENARPRSDWNAMSP